MSPLLIYGTLVAWTLLVYWIGWSDGVLTEKERDLFRCLHQIIEEVNR